VKRRTVRGPEGGEDGSMKGDLDRILISEGEIAARVAQMAGLIAADLLEEIAGTRDMSVLDDDSVHERLSDRIVFIPIMTGALIFTADLVRRLPFKLSLELIAVSSYPGRATESKGARIDSALPDELAGKHVVVIDDILDSGRTMDLVRERVQLRRPASVRSAVLLDKRARREVDVRCDYAGFEIPDEFVVGYGLDYGGLYRNLPDIAVLRREVVGGGR